MSSRRQTVNADAVAAAMLHLQSCGINGVFTDREMTAVGRMRDSEAQSALRRQRLSQDTHSDYVEPTYDPVGAVANLARHREREDL